MKLTDQYGLMYELEKDYCDFMHRKRKYRKEVKCISELFRLGEGEKEGLRGDVSPAYFVGKYNKKNHFVVFGINPGYIEEQDKLQEQENKKSLMHYKKHHYNFFRFFKKNKLKSPYWKKFWPLFSGFKSDNTKKNYWDFFDVNVTGLNLIPYHSTRTKGMPYNFSKTQFGYLKYRLDLNIDFIKQYEPKLLIFNGKPWQVLLVEHKLVDKFKKRSIRGKFNVYFFEYKGIKSILFDKFLSSVRGLTHEQIRNKIARIIVSEYPSVGEK